MSKTSILKKLFGSLRDQRDARDFARRAPQRPAHGEGSFPAGILERVRDRGDKVRGSRDRLVLRNGCSGGTAVVSY